MDIKSILKKTKKTKNDLNFLINHFKDFKFFKQYYKNNELEILNKLFNCIEVQENSKYDVVFYLNDISDKFYLIYKGSVKVYKNLNTEEINSLIELKKLDPKIDLIKNKEMYSKLGNIKIFYNNLYKIPLIKDIATIKEGDFFGEAIWNDQKRNSHIICNDYCEFFVLNEKNYNIILGKKEKAKYEKVLNQLKNILFNFNDFEFNTISKLKINKEIIYKPNWLINYDDKVEDLILLLKGKVKIVFKFNINMIKIPENLKKDKNFIKYLYFKSKDNKNLKENLKNKILEKTYYILNENSILGLYEFYKNIDFFDYKVELISPKIEVLFIKNNNLNDIFKKVPLFKKELNLIYDKKKIIYNKKEIFENIWKNQFKPINYENIFFYKNTVKDIKNENILNLLKPNIKIKKSKNKNKKFIKNINFFDLSKKHKLLKNNFKIKKINNLNKTIFKTNNKNNHDKNNNNLNKSFNKIFNNKFNLKEKISYIKDLNKIIKYNIK